MLGRVDGGSGTENVWRILNIFFLSLLFSHSFSLNNATEPKENAANQIVKRFSGGSQEIQRNSENFRPKAEGVCVAGKAEDRFHDAGSLLVSAFFSFHKRKCHDLIGVIFFF